MKSTRLVSASAPIHPPSYSTPTASTPPPPSTVSPSTPPQRKDDLLGRNLTLQIGPGKIPILQMAQKRNLRFRCLGSNLTTTFFVYAEAFLRPLRLYQVAESVSVVSRFLMFLQCNCANYGSLLKFQNRYRKTSGNLI